MKVSVIFLIFVVASLLMPVSQVYSEKAIEPVIKFDKSEYGPLDLVTIEIIYPPANADPEIQDTIQAKIFTSSGTSRPLVLYETKPGFVYGWYQYQYHADTGIFYSYIQLAELPQWEGVLQVQRGDVLTVEFKTKDNMIFTKKVDINFNLGQVRFSKDAFSSRETVEIFVSDLDRNNNPNMINTLPVMVWSTTDRTGVMVTLRETDANSGEFSAFMTLTRTETSSGNRLRVSEGDTITARYTDNTRIPTDELTPKGSKTFAVREVFASALIGCICAPLERAITSEIQIYNSANKDAIPVTQLNTGDTAIIRNKITNAMNSNNEFAYITQVKNSDEITVSLSWIRSELKANETVKVESTWIPDSPGTYYVENFVWTAIDNPDPLSPTRTSEVKVLPGSDKEKTLLWIDTYPEYAVHIFEPNVIKGHLFGQALNGLPNHEITIYLESIRTSSDTGWFNDQKVGSTVTDENGCFYFPLLEYNIRELYHNFTESKNLNSNMSAIVTLNVEFVGNTVYHMSSAKSRIYYNADAFTFSSPPFDARLINGTRSVYEIGVSQNSETSLQLWVSNQIMEGVIELDVKNLPCGVEGEFDPEILSFEDELQKLSTLSLSTANNAKFGNYSIQIVTKHKLTELQLWPNPTQNMFEMPGPYAIVKKEMATELLWLQLRIN